MVDEAVERLGVVGGDGLVGEVAARHHERAAADRGEEEVVQRRVGEHDADLDEVVGDAGSELSAGFARGVRRSGSPRRGPSAPRSARRGSASSPPAAELAADPSANPAAAPSGEVACFLSSTIGRTTPASSASSSGQTSQ